MHVRDRLRSLEMSVPQIQELEVDVDITRDERAYDVVLITRFDTVSDLEAYSIHPDHVPIKKEMALLAEHVATVDYEA